MSVAFENSAMNSVQNSAFFSAPKASMGLRIGNQLFMSVMFVCFLLPSLALAAAAIDLSRVNALRQDLHIAAQATALAAAQDENANDATLTGTMARLYVAQGGDLSKFDGLQVTANRGENGVSVRVSAEAPTMLLPLMGLESFAFSVTASSARLDRSSAPLMAASTLN